MDNNNYNRRDGENGSANNERRYSNSQRNYQRRDDSSRYGVNNSANGGTPERKHRPRIQRPVRTSSDDGNSNYRRDDGNNNYRREENRSYRSDNGNNRRYNNNNNNNRGNQRQASNDPNRFEYAYADNDDRGNQRGNGNQRGGSRPRNNGQGRGGYKPQGRPLAKKRKKTNYSKVPSDAAKYLRDGYRRATTEGQERPQIDALPNRKTYASQGLVRLNRYIANAGICSRREADKLIQSGAVTVNGEVVTQMGYLVKEGDVVNYGGESLRSESKRYFLLNKPKGYITTNDDPKDRKTVMELIDNACNERIYPVGRLDRNTTGLLLFTNDGELSRKLTHPSTGVYKVYQVELDKPVSFDDMIRMSKGIELEDGVIVVDDVAYANGGIDRRVVGLQIHSGKNRIVRRIFESMGYSVRKLDRTVFAGLTKKDLPRGRYRELTETEVGYLKMI